MGKKISRAQMETTVALCSELGIHSTGNFLIGFPDDTRETVNETITMARRLKRLGARIQLSVLTPFPGTYYFNHARELGITIHTNDWDDFTIGTPIISTANFSRDEIREIYFDHTPEMKF